MVGNGYAWYFGPTSVASRHAHNALQLIVTVDQPVKLRLTGAWQSVRHAAIPSNLAHEFDGAGAVAHLVYVDTASALPRALTGARAGVTQFGSLVESSSYRAWFEDVARAAGADASAFATAVAAAVAGLQQSAAVGQTLTGAADCRVTLAHDMLQRAGATRLTAAQLACEVRLSPGRLSSLFRQEYGLPLRRYALWMRLQRATAQLQGDPRTRLSVAAHAAGFADAAHMTRTYRRMLGVAPSALFGIGT